ncbi:MAG: 3-isopropylmalate dehydratase [Lentisphaerae bacterium]|nr:3-isopropylmalate dehydratase [Lentisphaerota bacterium]
MENDTTPILAGRVYVLGDNIDTDQIIPAQHLNLVPTIPEEYRQLGALALSGLPEGGAAFIKPGEKRAEYKIIVAGRNFGCGSSREHAGVALAAAGIRAIVAESYARIFFRNAVATGALFPFETEKDLRSVFQTGAEAEIQLEREELKHLKSGQVFKLKSLGAARPVIAAGGLFAYARKMGMIKTNH